MIWFAIRRILYSLVELVRISQMSESDKDLEILILGHQLDVLTRQRNRPVRLIRRFPRCYEVTNCIRH